MVGFLWLLFWGLGFVCLCVCVCVCVCVFIYDLFCVWLSQMALITKCVLSHFTRV